MRVALTILLAAMATAHAAIDPASVVVVSAKGDAESAQLAAEYAKLRGIPATNRIELEIPKAGRDTVSWRQYADTILNPLRAELLRRNLIAGELGATADELGRLPLVLKGAPRARWIVLCRGLPWRIRRDNGPDGKAMGPSQGSEAASVDSELCLLASVDTPPHGPRPNPWFGTKDGTEPKDTGQLLRTARLDGPSLTAVLRSLKGMAEAERRGLRGRAYIDLGGPYPDGDTWFSRADAVCRALGFPTDVDKTKDLFGADARFDSPAIYLGWYSGSPKGKLAEPGAMLAPGAIALHLHSFSGQALRDSKRGWTAALVERGAALTFGNVDEPYLAFTVRPDLLLANLAAGETAGEAAWRATPAMSWMGVIVGDPLYRPFAHDLQAQMSDFGRQVEPAGAYAALRAAELMRDRPEERRRLLLAALLRCPRLALLLELSQDAVSAGKDFGWDNRALPFLGQEDFGLVLSSARFLKAHGKATQATELYEEAARRMTADPARAKALRDEAGR
ncbi:MAG: TIGR03790 family protein [Opitutales bacterium]